MYNLFYHQLTTPTLDTLELDKFNNCIMQICFSFSLWQILFFHIEHFLKIEMVFWKKRKNLYFPFFVAIYCARDQLSFDKHSKSAIFHLFTEFINLICKSWILSCNSTLFSSKLNKQSFDSYNINFDKKLQLLSIK